MPTKRRLPPGIRQLPSGKYQATVYGPDGHRYTETFPLQRAAVAWRDSERAKITEGRWRDPRAGAIPFTEWADKWFAARVVEDETMRGDRGTYRLHIEPHWNKARLNGIDTLAVQTWIKQLQKERVGNHAIRRAYNLFKVMMGDAVAADRIVTSPCRKSISLPATPPKLPAWFTRDQVDRIRAELETGDPATRRRPRLGHSVMVELMVCSGPRWGEAAAIVGRTRVDDIGNPVDWLRGKVKVVGALDQKGRWKSYPKTSKSRREIPVPPHVLAAMGGLLQGREPDAWVFTATRQDKPLSGANWRVVWYQALDAANDRIRRENRGRKPDQQVPPIPRLDPHDCRHTAASWLVQAGVPLYDVQALLGHSSHSVTARYAHLATDRHDPIERAWQNLFTHLPRTGRNAVEK